ncbi:MAG: hypothetical protein HY208_02315 [Nitrospirae bacterium]|nr:hypothetical protein [Nitrospirota bacterium]
MTKVLPIIVAAVFVSGCASAPSIPPTLTYREGTRLGADRDLTHPCPVTLVSVTDERSHRDTGGSVKQQPAAAGTVVPWVEAAVLDLKRSGYDVARGVAGRAGAAGKGADLELKIVRVDVSAHSIRYRAVVELHGGLSGMKRDRVEAVYRGDGDRISWFGGRSGLEAALSDALRQAMGQLIAGAQGYCRSSTESGKLKVESGK